MPLCWALCSVILSLALTVPDGAVLAQQADDRPSFARSSLQLDRGDGVFLTFDIELAVTPSEHQFGLMHLEVLPVGSGMLFIFPQSRQRNFWMKNTLIPLDMLFFDEAGRLVSFIPNVPPETLTSRKSQRPARYVLELNAGTMQRLGIGMGARLVLPVGSSG